jgi:hypothetical protein
MQEKYKKYWKKMNTFTAISIVFDPRCKMEMIDFLLSEELSPEELSTSLNQIKTNISSWFNELTGRNGKDTSKKPHQSNKGKTADTVTKTDDNNRFKRYLAGKKSNQTVSPTAELELYLQEATVEIDTPSFDLLNWWKVNSLRFSTLATMAKTVLMIPMTLIASESAFSTGGRMLSDSQSRLKPETLEALICGQDWISHNKGIYEFTNEYDELTKDNVVVIS